MDAEDGVEDDRSWAMIYTSGTKMPEQMNNSASDRKALIKFFDKVAMGKN